MSDVLEQLFRALDLVRDGVVVVDATSEAVLHANTAASSLIGVQRDDLLGRELVDLLRRQRRENGRHTTADSPGMLLRADGTAAPIWRRSDTVTFDGRIVRVVTFGPRERTDKPIGSATWEGDVHANLAEVLSHTVGALSSALELRDPYTAGHMRRVTELAGAIARDLGLEGREIEGLEVAARLHDIGKIAVPTEILIKPLSLSVTEFGLIRTHVAVGCEILAEVPFPWPVAEMVGQHHERLDGSGYPERLRGDSILPTSRILAVADVVEAMASNRPYRPAPGIGLALAEIESHRHDRYDPDVADVCLKLFREGRFALS